MTFFQSIFLVNKKRFSCSPEFISFSTGNKINGMTSSGFSNTPEMKSLKGGF